MFTTTITKIQAAQESIRNFEDSKFYARRYNELTEAERNEPSIGGRTRGQYLLDNFNRCMEYVRYYDAIVNAKED